MHIVKPEVYLIGHTHLRLEGIAAWLSALGGAGCLDHVTGGGPEMLIELSARRCYKSFAVGLNPNVTKIRTDSAEYHENILSSGHGAVLEHSSATFAFENVSRVFTHELCRNRSGIKDQDTEDDVITPDFGLSQESMRYVRLDDIPVWIPPEFDDDVLLRSRFCSAVEYVEHMLGEMITHSGMDKMSFTQKKKLTSALRRMIPMGVGTGIVWTANFRALRWLIEQRSSRHAEHEIRLVFSQVGEICREKWGLVFGDFTGEMVDGVMEWTPKYRKV